MKTNFVPTWWNDKWSLKFTTLDPKEAKKVDIILSKIKIIIIHNLIEITLSLYQAMPNCNIMEDLNPQKEPPL